MRLMLRLSRVGVAIGACLFCVSCNILSGPPNTGAGADTGGGVDGAKTLAVFQDPDSAFSTSDVYDVDFEIVRFDTQAKSIIWAADERAFQEGMWIIDGNTLGAAGMFQVLFGNVDGQRRAFFTETGPATICDLSVVADNIRIAPTATPVPQ